jgi:polysaccharide biosynthesis protein PelB
MTTALLKPIRKAWYKSAADDSRKRLFPAGLVLFLAGLLLWLLWLMVPTKILHNQLGSAKQSDALTIAYMQTWVLADPQDADMRFLLARHLYIAGRYEEGLALAEALIRESQGVGGKHELLHNAQMLKLSVIEAQAFAFGSTDPNRTRLLDEARAWLASVVAGTNDKILLGAYLRRSMALDDLKLTKQVMYKINPSRYKRDSGTAPSAGESDIANSNPLDELINSPEARAKDAVANGRWQEAADLYWAIYDHTPNQKAKKDFLLLLVRNEQWGNRLPLFFKALDSRMGSLPNDKEILKKLAKLALAANRLDIAEKFVRQLMQFPQTQGSINPLHQILAWLNPIATAHAAEISDEPYALDHRDWETGIAPIKKEEPPLPRAAFEEETFLLAYQVFMSKGDQEDAYKVAAHAVKQIPKNLEWRHRLAQISEWTQRPEEALSHWLYLAKNSRSLSATISDLKKPLPLITSDAAWLNVKRLASMLNQLPSLILVLEYEQTRAPGDTRIDRSILKIEETLGHTEQAIKRLQKRIKALGPPTNRDLFDALVGLANRLKNTALISQVNADMDLTFGKDLGRSVSLANTIAEHGNFQAAYDILAANDSLAKNPEVLDREMDKKIRYWSTLADYAHALQKNDVAMIALSEALTLGSAQSSDLELLANLLEESSVSHAAAVTFQAFLIDGQAATFKRAAIRWLQGDRFQELKIAMGYLNEAQRIELLGNIDFLKARATYYQAQGRFQEALTDYRSAMRIEPKNSDIHVGLIWLLMAAKKAPALEQLLRQWHPMAMKDPAYWGAFGAAYLTLGEPQRALPFFAKQAKGNDDYLWRLSYADALETVGMPDPAWTLRRRAWTEIQKMPSQEIYSRIDTRDRVVALSLQFAPADSAKKLLATLVRDRELKFSRIDKNRYSPTDPPITSAEIAALASPSLLTEKIKQNLADLAQADADKSSSRDDLTERTDQKSSASELALSYLLSKEKVESARAWLLTRYATALSRPTWASLSVALVTQDKAQLAKLLDDVSDWLPRYDRAEAMKQIGRTAEAQTSTFETLASRPNNQEAYRSFLGTLSDDTSGISLSSASGRFSELTFSDTTVSAAWRFNQRWLIHANAAKGTLEWESPPSNLAPLLPLSTQRLSFGLKAVVDKGVVSGNIERHQLLREFTGLQGEWQVSFERGWGVNLKAAKQSPTNETPALRIGGLKDSFQLRVSHQITGRDSASMSLGAARYSTQTNTTLGTGMNVRLEYAHQIERLSPGWTFKAELARAQFSRRAGTDSITDLLTPAGFSQPSQFFLPSSYTQADVFLSTTDTAQGQGRGPLKPFVQGGLRFNSLTGAGYNGRVGVAGSLFGHDSFLLYFQGSSATPGSNRGSQEIGLKYNYFF